MQAELEELEAQEEAYQAEQLDRAWTEIREDLAKALDIEDAEDADALRGALGEQEVLSVLKAAMVEVGEEAVDEAVGPMEEAPEGAHLGPREEAGLSEGAFPWRG